MSSPNKSRTRLRAAKRIFSLIPPLVFIAMFLLFATQQGIGNSAELAQVLMRSLVVALAASFVCIAAYGFYRYLHERSSGL